MTIFRVAAALVALAVLLSLACAPARADAPELKIAVQSSLTGISQAAGSAFLEAISFAVEEANSAGASPRFAIQTFDDASTEDGSRAAAGAIVASDAAIVLGPARTPLAISACKTFAEAGLPILATTLHADELTENATTFRTVISTGEIGEALADYLAIVLHQKRAIVFTIDNGYGRPLAERFRAAAARQEMDVVFRTFSRSAERDVTALQIAAESDQAPVVLGMEYEDAGPVLKILRRQGHRGIVLGTATMARASFRSVFAGEPEEQREPGFFTEQVYSASPAILDSANAQILDFASRYQRRFGHQPSWEAVQAYDGALLAMAALKKALSARPDFLREDVAARRAAALAAVKSFDSPTHALLGLNGPIWFDQDRIRRQPVRMGRFHAGVYESAPVQIVPVDTPDAADLRSGAVFPTEAGQYARLQRVVQTGAYLNLMPRLDVAKSTFTADFYFWLRYARDAGPAAADPADIGFPDMVGGRFDPSVPSESTEMPDGTLYRLWRVQGDFRSEFDLRRFPFDVQHVELRFFNARAASDRIVYVIDRRSLAAGGTERPAVASSSELISSARAAPSAGEAETVVSGTLASPTAFLNLTQWRPTGASERRDTLVTASALGDVRRLGLKTPRELSGFVATFELDRRTSAVLIKMLFPILLMTVVMYTTLHFPVALTKEKVTVAVTAALSGAVLLSAVNNQLGGVGYTILAEYAFYAFFALGLLCILYVTAFEAFRLNGRTAHAARVQTVTRGVFLASVAAMVAAAAWLV